MKNILAIAFLAATTCIGSLSASAQTHTALANVPFDFTVGSTPLPAGTYTITSSAPSHVIWLDSRSGGHAAVMGLAGDSRPLAPNKIVFHKYGSDYFLSDVRCDSASLNMHITPSKKEKEVRQRLQEVSKTQQPGLASTETVFIALNK